ncbi:CHAP domain-containing protein [Actinocorallia populi]|uniref:CHAP domain-containing protein n=1 Tax=Actinocorallia populi TaxID=2079200 RepID=UPI000D089855|nr:CHAP domain-containing protein [Actinocorallia populi]
MNGRHRKNFSLTAKIAGGLLAGSTLATTFAVAADANTLPADSAVAGKSATVNAAALHTGLVLDGLTTAKKDTAREQEQRGEVRADLDADVEKQVGKGASADDFIKKAKTQLGIREDGSGKTKFQEWYAKTERAAETVERDGGSRNAYLNAAWCNMFVSWVAEETGMEETVGQDAWTIAHAKWFKEQDRWGTTPKKGAIVFFNWQGEKDLDSIVHVGIVTDVDGDTVKTIEGNTGNAVLERDRKPSQIVGYGYPEYAG